MRPELQNTAAQHLKVGSFVRAGVPNGMKLFTMPMGVCGMPSWWVRVCLCWKQLLQRYLLLLLQWGSGVYLQELCGDLSYC